MKKRLLLMAALLFVSGASMAQKVVNVDGKAVIDNRDMPAKTITKDEKARKTNGGTDKTLGRGGLTDLGSAESNKTVSHYFEVMKTDYDNGGAMTITWLTAIQGCANYDSGDGSTWRLPTQRELMLIWALHVSMKNKVTNFVSFNPNHYWSATEDVSLESWFIDFDEGFTNTDRKSYSFRARCIRDLTPVN